MQDFPPQVTTFDSGDGTPPSSDPDTRSPGAFLRWMLKQQWKVVTLSALASLLWLLPMTLGPWIFGKAVDDAILGGSVAALWGWTGVMVVVVVIGGVFGVVFHTLIVRTWLISLYGTTKMVTRKIAQMGHVLPRRSPTGEVLSVASSDSDEFGALTEIIARAGRTAGVLPRRGCDRAVDLAAARAGRARRRPAPARRLRCRSCGRCTAVSRSSAAATPTSPRWPPTSSPGFGSCAASAASRRSGATMRASRRARHAGGRVGSGIWQAAVEAVGVLFSGVFLVSLVWLGSRQVAAGALSVGQLVSFLGYGLFMVGPIRTFFELAQKIDPRDGQRTKRDRHLRAAAALARTAPPAARWTAPASSSTTSSGFVAQPGRLTVVVSAVPERVAAARRPPRPLPAGRHRAGRESRTRSRPMDRAARRARAERARRRAEHRRARRRAAPAATGACGSAGSTWPRPALADVRSTDPGQRHRQPALRRARCRTPIDPHGRADPRAGRARPARRQRRGRLRRAAGGWQGQLDERGRGLSGGQRQRVVLARALAADAAGAGAGRADVGRGRPHRGPDRRAGRRSCARGRTTVVMHRVAAVAPPRRPRRPARAATGS